MAALYSGTADEWCHLGTTTSQSSLEVDFNIGSFEEHMNKEGSQECLKSHQFIVNGKTFNIEVWPNGGEDGDDQGFVSIFLCSDDESDVEVSCTFAAGSIVEMFNCQMIDSDRGLGFGRFIPHEKCKLELKNGVFELKVNVTVKEKNDNTLIVGKGKRISKDCPQKSISSKMYEDKFFTDFEIISDGKSYPCHKVVLSVVSPVFRKMMESEMKEALESTLVLESHPEEVINSFLRFIYTGEMDEKVMIEHCVTFLELGEKYDMEGLKVEAEQAMISSLNPENMISFLKAGQLLRGESIRAAAKTFICQNIKNVKDKEKLRIEVQGQTDLLMELLESLVGI